MQKHKDKLILEGYNSKDNKYNKLDKCVIHIRIFPVLNFL